jgi:uncharacterized protein (DUF1800 family)
MKKMLSSVVACALLSTSLFSTSITLAGTFIVQDQNEQQELIIRLRATQFLRHATFGPTDAEIESLAARMSEVGITRAASEWIDDQFALPTTTHSDLARQMLSDDGYDELSDGIWIDRYRAHAWWHNSLTAPDQLKQRMAWALSQIVVIGHTGANFNNSTPDAAGNGLWIGMTNYYDMLLNNTDKTYRDLLGDVTFHGNMGVYLSHNRNRKANPTYGIAPDENYAREVLQLFSIGINELNSDGTLKLDTQGQPIPTYDNDTITEFARVFTGLHFDKNSSFYYGRENFTDPMVMYEQEHDTDTKTLLNGQQTDGTNGGIAEINAALNNIYAHENVAPFICRRLIQRFVCSNPSKAYIQRVVNTFNDNGQGVRGDLKEVVKQILIDREAFNSIRMIRRSNPYRLIVRSLPSERSRLMEPVLVYSTFLRRYANSEYSTGRYMIPYSDWAWGQAPYRSPTVFNFYGSDYQPSGPVANYTTSHRVPNDRLYAPEFQIFSSIVANRAPNRLRWDIYSTRNWHTIYIDGAGNQTRAYLNYDISTEEGLADDPTALVNYLDERLCCGTMTSTARFALINAITEETADSTERAKGALISVLTSPHFMIAE